LLSNHESVELLQETIKKLLLYCKENTWSGYDPYDGLNSRLFNAIPFTKNKSCRLVFIQVMKRLPINLRPIMLVPKDQNPKGLALFASALLKLSDLGLANAYDASFVLNRLIELRSPNKKYFCWGYNFNWQSRGFLIPKFEPNIICTTFAGEALLDTYKKDKNTTYLDMAKSAGKFLLDGLNISKISDEELCFSYTPLDKGMVHNANLMGAAFLARLYHITNEKIFLEYAVKAVKFSINRQNPDGSWVYGESPLQSWIDNFHTGYNLIALNRFCQYTGMNDFKKNIKKGLDFYHNHFFTDDCKAGYYHNRVYPIDIHSISQSIITLIELKALNRTNIELALCVCKWGIKNMCSSGGFFYYQKRRFYKNRISYMRWSQAWMLYALASLMNEIKND